VRRDRVLTLIALHAIAIVAMPGRAVIVAIDDFEAPTHPDSDRREAAGFGIRFYTRDAASAVSARLESDATFGSRALSVADQNTPSATSKPIIGLLPMTLQLANVNDFITLTFAFRLVNPSAATPAAANFRFGIHGSNGTGITGDSQPAVSDNDRGYVVHVGTGGSAPTMNNLFWNEAGGTFPILGGGDRQSLPASSAGISISNTSLHTAAFTVRRASATSLSLSLVIDGGTAITATDSGNIRTTFDEIAFSNGFTSTGLDYVIDDIAVSSNLPEPASLGLFGAAALVLALRRRRS
jgi:hypothetical protein